MKIEQWLQNQLEWKFLFQFFHKNKAQLQFSGN